VTGVCDSLGCVSLLVLFQSTLERCDGLNIFLIFVNKKFIQKFVEKFIGEWLVEMSNGIGSVVWFIDLNIISLFIIARRFIFQ